MVWWADRGRGPGERPRAYGGGVYDIVGSGGALRCGPAESGHMVGSRVALADGASLIRPTTCLLYIAYVKVPKQMA